VAGLTHTETPCKYICKRLELKPFHKLNIFVKSLLNTQNFWLAHHDNLTHICEKYLRNLAIIVSFKQYFAAEAIIA
jgi:hypothetical protein